LIHYKEEVRRQIELAEVFAVATEENFDEKRYLKENPDIREAGQRGKIKSGYQHFKRHGHKEHRKQQKINNQDGITALRRKKAERIRAILKPGTAPLAGLTWFLRHWADNLSHKDRKKFLKVKVGDTPRVTL
jgi:hypothetical protein